LRTAKYRTTDSPFNGEGDKEVNIAIAMEGKSKEFDDPNWDNSKGGVAIWAMEETL